MDQVMKRALSQKSLLTDKCRSPACSENGEDPGDEGFADCRLFRRWNKATPRPLDLHASH